VLSGYGRVLGRKVGKGTDDGVEEVGVEERAGSRSIVPIEDTKDGPGVPGRWQKVEAMWSSEGNCWLEISWMIWLVVGIVQTWEQRQSRSALRRVCRTRHGCERSMHDLVVVALGFVGVLSKGLYGLLEFFKPLAE
jgi:hypothetical protein